MTSTPKKGTRRSFGQIQQMRSKRFQAKYIGPDKQEYKAPSTFSTKTLADRWLAEIDRTIQKEIWTPPTAEFKPVTAGTFGEYAAKWLAEKQGKNGTLEGRESHLRIHIYPTFEHVPIASITPAMIRTWHARPAKPVAKARAYETMFGIMRTAVIDELIVANPCVIKKGSKADTTVRPEAMSVEEVALLAETIYPRYSAMILVLAWTSIRFGEATALTVDDIDLEKRTVRISKGVTRTKAAAAPGRKTGLSIETPKSATSNRTVTLPKRVIDPLREHIAKYAIDGRVFPAARGGLMGHSTLQKPFKKACAEIGWKGATPHWMRHTGQTWAAGTGASFHDLMARAGQSTPTAALRYIHGNEERQKRLADGLDEL